MVVSQYDPCCLSRAYHGHSKLLIDISSYKHDALGGNGPGEFCHVVSSVINLHNAFLF